MSYYPNEVILDESYVPPEEGFGLIPRDYALQPLRVFNPRVAIPIVPMEQWPQRIAAAEQAKSRLSDIYLKAGWKHLDQGRFGYCWGHAAVHCLMLKRSAMNLPHVDLSAYAVCGTLVNGANRGGWSAWAHEKIVQDGCPTQQDWPQGVPMLQEDAFRRAWQNAKAFRISHEWADVASPYYQRQLSFVQVGSCLLAGEPVAGDFTWWGHAVALLDLVDAKPSLPATDPGRYGVRILNSWANWGERGLGVITGSRAIPTNATVVLGATPS